MEIKLTVGTSVITIKPDGISVAGVKIEIAGDATAEMKSAMTTVKGDAMLTLKGGMTMIN